MRGLEFKLHFIFKEGPQMLVSQIFFLKKKYSSRRIQFNLLHPVPYLQMKLTFVNNINHLFNLRNLGKSGLRVSNLGLGKYVDFDLDYLGGRREVESFSQFVI